ncbi:unnamed protein product [Meganyctiphanes norvegica]|uniref:LIM zinc-binding domain-containing protein n=1 Tax=Meganyctiphanes norvegica TaxID=48144 RepID=A0AAV2RBL8_MEGNR
MDPKIKSECIHSEQLSQNKGNGYVWESQKGKLENQLMYTTQQLANQFSPWMPIMNHFQHTGVLDFTPIGSSWHSPQTISNNDCCVGTSDELKTAKTHEFTPLANAAVKCYVCDQHVMKNEFALHLFFGALKCNDCQIKVIDCKSFRSDFFMSSNCIHKHLSWSDNPIDFLKSYVHKTSKSTNKKVSHYVKRLKSLEQLLPWKSAFQEYRRLKKLNSYSKTKCEPTDCNKYKCDEKVINTNSRNCDEVLLLESYDFDQLEDAVQVIGLVDHEIFQENYIDLKVEPKKIDNKCIVKVEQVIKDEKYTFDSKKIKKFNENRDIKSENLLIQSREINSGNNKMLPEKVDDILKNSTRTQSIKSAVENILLKDKLCKTIKFENSISHKQKQGNKSNSDLHKTILNLTENKQLKKKRKLQKKIIHADKNNRNVNTEVTMPNTQDNSMEATLPTGSDMEFLDLPEDGNYLVTQTAIEECPMCYTKLNINECRVNIKLLLYTFGCQCGLKIFFVPKTPKNIEHPVKIIENM